MNPSTIAASAVENALEAQPAWKRRKSTLIVVLQGVGWLLGVLATVSAGWPEWAVLLIGGLSTLVAAALSALTKGELTPSMVKRVAQHAPKQSPLAPAGDYKPGDYASYILRLGAGHDHS